MQYICSNSDCKSKNHVTKKGAICDDCKIELAKLENEIRFDNTPLYVDKNEGLRRHVKSWWKK